MPDHDPPSPWMIFVSPSAVAWFALHRPLAVRRLTTLATGLWLGVFLAWARINIEERFGRSAVQALVESVLLVGCVVVLVHGWTWFCRRSLFGDRVRAAAFAWFPAIVVDAPDAVLSLYRDAVYFDRVSDPVALPPLPNAIEAYTQTCLHFFACLAYGLVFALLTVQAVKRAEPPNAMPACSACGYDLRGTLAAGIERCPECGRLTDQVSRVAQESASPK